MAPSEPGDALGLTLSPLEVKLLRALRGSSSGSAVPEEELARTSGLGPDATRGSLERLRSKRLTLLEERSEERWSLSPVGQHALKVRLPELRVHALLAEKGPLAPEEVPAAAAPVEITREEVTVAIGQLRRQKCVEVGEKLSRPTGLATESEGLQATLSEVERGAPLPARARELKELLRRGLVVKVQRAQRSWRLSPEGASVPLEEGARESVGAITPVLLLSGGWEKAHLRPYDVRAEVPRALGVRTHLYREWLRQVEEVLVGLGFEEYRSPLVELEFYNNDLLFMPQEHPARSMHDMFFVEGVEGKAPPARLLKGVRAVHQGQPPPRQKEPLSAGWQTPYRDEVARRVVLRSQTTAASMRYLAGHPKAPFRMYCLDSVFRYDPLDATHLIQFDQCEGVIGKRGLNFRHLLGVLSQFARAIGIKEVRFQPTYFPFTEPSVQGFVKHPTLGWVEMIPGGMFRPEVLRPLGIRVPVAAWGIGIGRLAMVALGLSDIRDLYMDDLGRLARARI